MIAIVFANELEAEPFLKLYQRGRFDGLLEGETVQDNHVIVTVTGSGKIKATIRTERLLHAEKKIDRLIHPGTCSSLNNKIGTGTIVGISQVFEGDRIELSAPSYPRMPLEAPFDTLPDATLVTQDHTPEGESEQSYWQRIADLSDNTSYAVAYVSATHGIPCNVVKVVTGEMFEKKTRQTQEQRDALEHLSHFLVEALQEQT